MFRTIGLIVMLAAPAQASALEIDMAVPSGLLLELESIEVRGSYMEINAKAQAAPAAVTSAHVTCKAMNREGYTWSLDAVMNNLLPGEPAPITLISLATMEDYEIASPVIELRCYPLSIKYGHLDLFP